MHQHRQHFTEFDWEAFKVSRSISSSFRLILATSLRCFPQVTQAVIAGEILNPKNIIHLTPSK